MSDFENEPEAARIVTIETTSCVAQAIEHLRECAPHLMLRRARWIEGLQGGWVLEFES